MGLFSGYAMRSFLGFVLVGSLLGFVLRTLFWLFTSV